MTDPWQDPERRDGQTNDWADEGDFMRLIMTHEPALRAFARTLLPHWNLVDEVIQEASVTLWQKFDQLGSEDGFLPWAKVIVRYKCLSVIDSVRRDRHVFSDGVLEMLADEAERLDADHQVSTVAALRSCLDRFSQPHQELLLAPYVSHGGIKALATQAGKSPNALYKLVGRLRDKLTTCIQRNLAGEVS